tara:strand:+ start:1272 stop:1514 length:243 start_codon:yes stop_codon:yes gene_type:complete
MRGVNMTSRSPKNNDMKSTLKDAWDENIRLELKIKTMEREHSSSTLIYRNEINKRDREIRGLKIWNGRLRSERNQLKEVA